jgi:hypothetical protein
MQKKYVAKNKAIHQVSAVTNAFNIPHLYAEDPQDEPTTCRVPVSERSNFSAAVATPNFHINNDSLVLADLITLESDLIDLDNENSENVTTPRQNNEFLQE